MTEKIALVLDETPTLRSPVLLAAFAGWGDGAIAGTGALQYLVGKYDARRIGAFESDDVYEYTTTRPVSMLTEDGSRELVWPSLALYACSLPEADRDAVILIGPEPNLRWRAVATAVVDVAEQLGITEVVVLGSYWDRVSHLGPLLSGRPGDGAMRERLQALRLPESGYQGPTGFTSALMDATTRAGLAAAGISGRAPHYVQGIGQPRLAHGLLRTVEQLVGLRFDADELETAGREQERLLTERAREDPKLWDYVQRLAAEAGRASGLDDFASTDWQTVTAADGTDGPSSAPSRVAADRGELPSGKDAVDAVEEFLRGNGQN